MTARARLAWNAVLCCALAAAAALLAGDGSWRDALVYAAVALAVSAVVQAVTPLSDAGFTFPRPKKPNEGEPHP